MKKVLSYLKSYKLNLTVGPFFKLLEAIFELLVPLIMADLIDNGINNPNATLGFILGRGAIIIGLGMFGLGFSLICQYTASKCSQGYGTKLRNGLYEHINKLSFSQLDYFGSSTLITRMTSDINQLQHAVAMLIRLVIRAPFLVIGSAVMAIIINPLLGTIFVVVAPLLALCIGLIMKKTVPLYKKIQTNLDSLTKISQENLSGVRVIRAFSNTQNQIEKFDQSNQTMTKNSLKVGIISALLNPLTFAIINIAIACVLYFGSKMANSGNMSQGEIIAFINYLTQISLALIVTAQLVIIYTKAYSCAKRVEEVLQTPVEQTPSQEIAVGDCDLAVEFENVSFGYNSKLLFYNISFRLLKGQSLGIIGGTGSGKSTIANLIAGFYPPSGGSVKVCGIDNREFSNNQLSKLVSFTMQNPVIFSGTIRSNLLLANPNAQEQDIINALKIAQAYEFVDNMPDKLDSISLQNGKNFSGGQKQRLSIARSVINNPKVLILDDSSSALDYITEARLFKAINSSLVDTAKVIISQRVNTIKNCDTIIVMEGGKICGTGTHKELLKTCGIYKEILQSQQKEGKK